MIEGKVKALFSDKERTELLFPITKTSAITNDDGVGLDAIISDTVYSDTNAIKATAVPVNADTLGGKPADEFATQNYVAAEIAKAQLNGGDVDLSGFATKDDVSNAVNGIDFPVDSVNGKTGAVSLSAGDVGATPASHAEDKNNPHGVTPEQIGAHPNTWVPTAEQIGAAPAGYGWGEGRPASQFTANNVNRTAVFVSAGEDMPTNDSAWLCEFYATSSDGSGNYGHMVATCQGGIAKGCICYRLRENGVYGEWEWGNPPMIPSVEYRTTERWNGSPVYVKMINCGTMPDKTYTQVSNVLPSGAKVISMSGFCRKTGFTSVVAIPSRYCHVGYEADWNGLFISTDDDFSLFTGFVTIKYLKD